ncbi:snake venom metalloprotease inhibitor 02A10 [Ditylenchus destructor]|uniref:Snake venom metalloprotease inhibitor 02A10 n=1 Tax=Ditylenchus destructor TaxID=166010 RepID=A0AAD4MLN9_9BILA|nr:snake venom metalloprotease inhibitor 02A10 [Ditylenchus destructor]
MLEIKHLWPPRSKHTRLRKHVRVLIVSPAGIFIKLNNGDGKRYETNVPWNLCSANRCPYTVEDVPNHVGHTYTIGVTEYYYGNNNVTDPNYGKNKRDRHNHVVWSTETAVLKPGENKQDIRYDKALSSVTLVVLSPVPTTASAVIPPATTSNVAPPASTSPVIPPVPASTSPVIPAVAASTSPVVPPIPAATSAVVPPVPAPTSAVIPPVPAPTSAVVPPVPAATSAVVPPVPAATSAVVPPVPAATPAVVPPVPAATSAVVPPVPAATSAVVPPVPAATSAVVTQVPAATSAVVTQVPAATSAVVPAATSKITVEGKLRVNLTDEIPKPDGIMLYLQIEGQETLHLTSYHWPSACPGDKCQYSIKDVIASVSKKYYIGVSLYYSPFGSNRGKPNKQAWSKVITVLKDGENKEDIMYYPAMPDVVCMNC